MITRLIENSINKNLFKGKTIILYGARQVGKTTLAKKILGKYKEHGRYLNCEYLSVEQNLSEPEPEKLKAYLGNYKLIVLDEAQNISNIGKILKILTDALPEIQIIATGSSSFEIANKTSEAMTGRVLHHTLYPFSVIEVKNLTDWMTTESQFEKLLIYGSYPEIYLSNDEDAQQKLIELTSQYLFRDIFKFEGIKKSGLIKNLVVALALQVGNQVSCNELGQTLGVSHITIQKYLDILEQSFVIFKLCSFSRNLRKELSKSFKIYFYDNGIRNAVINNFNKLSIRNDTGALWENFCISERIKSNGNSNRNVNRYFWRTTDQKEIDYVEELNGKISGYEIKYSKTKKAKIHKDFIESYDAEVNTIDKDNLWKFAELQY